MHLPQSSGIVSEGLEPHGAAQRELGRSYLYRLLSQAFFFPGPELPQVMQALSELARAAYPELPCKAPTELSQLELEAEYIALFDGADPQRYVSPYETHWCKQDGVMRRWEVLQFYRCFGLAVAKQRLEWPDHVCLELEFMQALSSRLAVLEGLPAEAAERAAAEPERLSLLHARRDFMARHLLPWIPSFCRALQEKARLEPYLELARLSARLIEDDARILLEPT